MYIYTVYVLYYIPILAHAPIFYLIDNRLCFEGVSV